MLKTLIFLLLSVLLCAPAFGAASSTIKEMYLNFGFHTEFYDAVQEEGTSGDMRKFDPSPIIGAGIGIPMSEDFIFLPEFNWVLPDEWVFSGEDEDDHVIVNTFLFRADFGYDAWEWLRLRLGTSMIWANQHGRGGSTKMNNGNSQSTFYYPDENRSSWNNTLDIGAEAFYDNLSLRFQTYHYYIFIEERRQMSYSLLLTYYWERQK